MRALVAGLGNIFFGDDGFGPQVVRLLVQRRVHENVKVRDFGISGMHLALEMLEPYDLIVLVDAVGRDAPAGTLYVIEPEAPTQAPQPDGHAMDVRAVLALYARLRQNLHPGASPKIFVVGCVPGTVAEGMSLSEPVRAALEPAIDLVHSLIERHACEPARVPAKEML